MNTKTAKLTRKNSNLKGTSPGQKAKQISFRTEDCEEVKFAPKALKLLALTFLPQSHRGYFTGSRDFVDYILAEVKHAAQSKRYRADSIAEDPMGYARSQIQDFIQNPGSISVSKQWCFCVSVHLLYHFGKDSFAFASKEERLLREGDFQIHLPSALSPCNELGQQMEAGWFLWSLISLIADWMCMAWDICKLTRCWTVAFRTRLRSILARGLHNPNQAWLRQCLGS